MVTVIVENCLNTCRVFTTLVDFVLGQMGPSAMLSEGQSLTICVLATAPVLAVLQEADIRCMYKWGVCTLWWSYCCQSTTSTNEYAVLLAAEATLHCSVFHRLC